MQTNLSIVHIPYESHLCFPLVCLHVGQKCFYRAMLYMHRADYIPSQDVCLSVTRRYSIDTAEHIVNFFTTRSPHHSSFSTPNSMAIFRRDPPPLTGASNARAKEYEKIAIFDQYLALSQKWWNLEPYTVNPFYLVQIKIYLTQIKNLFKNLTTQTLFVCNKYTY